MEDSSHVSHSVGTLVQPPGATAHYAGLTILHDQQPVAYHPDSDTQPEVSAIMVPSFNDVKAPLNMTASHSTGWATKEEWTKRKTDIKQLYVYEKKKLKEVKHLMESRYGFRATDKMYKTHIKQWGLDKKNKEPEMRAIVRKHKQRADQGKASTIHVRGQIRTIVEAFRYWERKGVSIEKIIARQTASPTPEAIEFFTPVPSPILTPQVLAIPECMFRSIRDYIKGSFESGMWYDADPLCECRSIKDKFNTSNDWAGFIAECNLASSLSRKNLSYEAEQTLSKAMRKIERILLAEVPTILTELFALIVHLRSQEEAEMALVILRQFSIMGKVLLGSEHPFSRIYEWFAKIYESDFGDIIIRCIELVASHFESSVGPLHLSTLWSRLNLIDIGTQRARARIQKLQNLLRECENTLRPEDSRVMQIRRWIAHECLYQGFDDDALSLSQTNIAYSQNQSFMGIGSYDYSRELCILAKCQHALGKMDLGIATLHDAIDARVSMWGTQDALARRWLLRLEEWYSEQGLEDSAAVAKDLSLIGLAPTDVD